MTNINTKNTENLLCPYCGTKQISILKSWIMNKKEPQKSLRESIFEAISIVGVIVFVAFIVSALVIIVS